jgi:dihydrofolate reductase
LHSIEQALELLEGVPEVMIIGGAALFEFALPRAERLYLTLVHATLEGDTYFPLYDQSQWREMDRQYYPADAKNIYAMSFISMERRSSNFTAD